jgi:hypothetical protein
MTLLDAAAADQLRAPRTSSSADGGGFVEGAPGFAGDSEVLTGFLGFLASWLDGVTSAGPGETAAGGGALVGAAASARIAGGNGADGAVTTGAARTGPVPVATGGGACVAGGLATSGGGEADGGAGGGAVDEPELGAVASGSGADAVGVALGRVPGSCGPVLPAPVAATTAIAIAPANTLIAARIGQRRARGCDAVLATAAPEIVEGTAR